MTAWIFALYLCLALAGALMLRETRRALEASAALPAPRHLPPVTVIKPVYGVDEHAEEALGSWFRQRYPGEVQLVFSLQDAADPALALIERLGREAGRDFEILVNPVLPGWSGKTSNLRFGLERARHEHLVFSDGDIVAPPDTLAKLVGQLVEGRQVVSCLVRTCRAANVWARQYALFWNAGLMSVAAPALHRGLGSFLPGGTVGLTRAALATMGGLEALRSYAAEDLAMSRLAAERGLAIGLGPTVDSPVGTMGFGAYLQKMARGHLMHLMAGVRRGLGYAAGMLLLLGAPSLGLALGLVRHDPALVLGSLAFALLRSVQAGRLAQLAEGGGHTRPALDLPFTVTCGLATLPAALWRRHLTWGGITYRVGYRARMRAVQVGA